MKRFHYFYLLSQNGTNILNCMLNVFSIIVHFKEEKKKEQLMLVSLYFVV